MKYIKEIVICGITIELDNFSVIQLEERLDSEEYFLTKNTFDESPYCKVTNSNGNTVIYLEFKDNRVTDIVADATNCKFITENGEIITSDELKNAPGSELQVAVCDNDRLDFPRYVYVKNNKCISCEFNILSKSCKDRIIKDWICAKKLSDYGVIIKIYTDGAIGIDRNNI